MNDRLYVGVRAKFLMGIARAKLNYDHFRVSLADDAWKIDAIGQLDVTGAGAAPEDINYAEDGTYKLGDFDNFKPTKPAGYGFAVDLGATYDILDNLQASLAVTDLGFISWSKKYNSIGLSSKSMEFSGVIVDENRTERTARFRPQHPGIQPQWFEERFEDAPRIDQRRTRIRGVAP